MNDKRRQVLMIGASVIAGSFIAAQSRTISGLSVALDNWIVAAFLSFSSGTLIIGAILLFSRRHRARVRPLLADLRSGSFPFWGLLGGVFGGFFVMMQGFVAAAIGVALFSVGVVAGQAMAALIIDNFGLLSMTKRQITLARLLGLVLTFSGLVITADLGSYSFTPLILFAVLAGAGTGVQQALNGRIRATSGSPVLATLINFVAGTLLIALALLISGHVQVASFPTNPLLYLGGAMGVTFIFLQVVVVQHIGTLALGISMLFGQLCGSLLLDLVIPVSDRSVTSATLIGILLALVGASVLALRR